MASIDSLKKSKETYSVSAAYDDVEGTIQTTRVTGDREGGLFANADNGLGKLDFLKLLTTQMQYQDPLSPMENTEFVAQLAQFSQLESTTSMEKSMKDMAQVFKDSIDLQTFNSQSTTNASSVGLIGKEVRLQQNTFEWDGKKPMSFKAHLGEKSSGVVKIIDGDGNVVKSINLSGKDSTNAVTFMWDGTNDRGEKMAKDTYNLVVDGQETNSSLYCFVEDFVTGVRFDSAKGAMVRVNNIEIPIGNILEVKMAASDGGMGGGMSGLTMSQALGMIGHKVKLEDTNVYYNPANSPAEIGELLNVHLDLGGTSTATLEIVDNSGRVVKTIPVTASELTSAGGLVKIEKINYSDSPSYSIRIAYPNKNAYFYEEGKITGVLNKGGQPQLKMGNQTIDASKILEVSAG